jgi:hypothetical protein
VLKDKARIQRQANDRPLNPGEKCELHFLTILYPPEIPALNADHQAFLEREPISSECPFDSDGFPIEYHRPVCPAPERVLRQHQKLLQGNPTIHGHSPNRNPTPKKIFKSSSWYRASALSIVNCPRKKGD